MNGGGDDFGRFDEVLSKEDAGNEEPAEGIVDDGWGNVEEGKSDELPVSIEESTGAA